MNKNIKKWVVFSILVLFLSGCASKKSESEIIMWLVGSEGQAQVINRLSQKFYEESKIKVRCEAISWGEAHSKYLTAVAGGVAPDIGTMGLTWGTEFGNLGAMVTLNELYPEDVLSMKSQVFPGIWSAAEYKGKIYAIPFDLSEHVFYYRSDIVPNPPQTWDELTVILEKLHKDNKGMIFDWGTMSWLGFAPFLWQSGGDFYNEDGTKLTIDSPESVRAMKFFAGLYNKYNVPKTKIPLEQGMRTGDFPLAISGNWKINGITLGAPEIAGKWSIALLPKGPNGRQTSFIGGRVMGIFSQSKKRDGAWKFIKFLFRPDIQLELYKGAQESQDTYLPPNISAWDSLPMDAAFKNILKAQALDAKGPPSVLGWDSNTRFIDKAIQEIILEDKDAKGMLEAAAKSIEEEQKK